ncbi:MAG: hypothetical protein HQM02_12615 [Magnetococcales bacterium]|nr:hypothetical protein [Magnetococcales bacterium]
MRHGVAHARWPGRLECFPGPPPLWLDGAHNPDGVLSLTRFMAVLARREPRSPSVLIFSVLRDKAAAAMVALLRPWVERVFVVSCGGERALGAEALLTLWRDAGVSVVACPRVPEALAAARAAAPAGRIWVAGSLWLVGEVRSLLL